MQSGAASGTSTFDSLHISMGAQACIAVLPALSGGGPESVPADVYATQQGGGTVMDNEKQLQTAHSAAGHHVLGLKPCGPFACAYNS